MTENNDTALERPINDDDIPSQEEITEKPFYDDDPSAPAIQSPINNNSLLIVFPIKLLLNIQIIIISLNIIIVIVIKLIQKRIIKIIQNKPLIIYLQ